MQNTTSRVNVIIENDAKVQLRDCEELFAQQKYIFSAEAFPVAFRQNQA